AVAPLVFVLGTSIIVLVGCVFPMRPDHYPAALIQLVSTYFLFSILANMMSILTPMAVAPGSMKASNVKIIPVLVQLAVMMFFPLVFLPAVIPIGIEALLSEFDILKGWPVSLTLSVLVLGLVLLVYRKLITLQGNLLLAREQKVLEVVTSKSE